MDKVQEPVTLRTHKAYVPTAEHFVLQGYLSAHFVFAKFVR
jgi:hypothetical protein